MPKAVNIRVIGNVIELSRDQWKGHVAKITNDPSLLEEVKKYTWTYKDGEHPYLHSSKLNIYFHEFVLGFIYGRENIDRMQAEGNIIEHLDNDGLNCTYENLHILSEDLNKAKAFSPIIIRDGVTYLNLDAKVNGKPMSALRHTSMRSVVEESK